MIGELWPRNVPPVCKMLTICNFCGFCLCILGVARIDRPHLNCWTCASHVLDYCFLCLLGLEGQFSATEDIVVCLHVHVDTFWIMERPSGQN